MTTAMEKKSQKRHIWYSKESLKAGRYIFLTAFLVIGTLLLSLANAQTCHSNIQNIPAICDGGTITSDAFNGGRRITCQSGSSSLTVEGWDKPGASNPTYFELYKQAQAGLGLRICLDGACIADNGYARSTNYPVCTGGGSTCTPSAETCNGVDDDCDSQVDENNVCSSSGTCYSSLEGIPVTCDGTITSNSFNGCRNVACSSGGDSIQIVACEKPDSGEKTHFEIYRQSASGNSARVCIANTCIQHEGYVRSTNYPVCTEGGGSTCTPSAETCNSRDDDCDGQVDENNVCSSTSCYSELQNIPASCNGGTIQSDSFSGCRSLVCSEAGSSLSVMACNKPDSGSPQYFEMYRQVKTGSTFVELCLGSTCIGDNGYAVSSSYPICITTSGGSGGANAPPLAPTWLEPQQNAVNVDTVDFHIHAHDMQDPDGDMHIASDFEIWEVAANQRVWAIDRTTNPSLLTHVHSGDGVFQGNLAGQNRLKYDTQYKVRARYYSNSATNSMSPWSVFHNFRTKPQSTNTGGPVIWSARSGYHVELVTSNINTPVNVVAAPNLYTHLPEGQRPLLYVTQLYGKVGVIKKDKSYGVYADNLLNFAAFGSIPGSGETGVDGIYVDPVTGDLFVSMVYADSTSPTGFFGKVTKFTTNDNGDGFTQTRDILRGIAVAPSHHVHTITRGPDGKLYLTTGDAHRTGTAKDSSTTNGKVLRFNDDGSVPSDNPVPGKYFYAGGFRNPFGAAWRPGTNDLFVSNNGPDSNDGMYRVRRGDIYGWCCNTASGTWHLWSQITAPVQVVFNGGGNNFPSDTAGSMFVALSGPTYSEGPQSGSKKIVQFKFNQDGTKQSVQDLAWYSGSGYGTPIGLAFASDGLYFTDIFGEDGFVGAAQTRGNIYKVVVGDGSGPTSGGSSFGTSIAPRPWYPKGLEMIWECKPTGGSGNYRYRFNFGDGQSTGEQTYDTAHHWYPAPGTYTASCTVRDLSTGRTATASTTITLNR